MKLFLSKYHLKFLFLGCCLLLCLPMEVSAENTHVQRTRISALRLQELVGESGVWERVQDLKGARFEEVDSVRLKGRVRGLGPVKLTLQKRRVVNWKSSTVLEGGEREESSSAPLLLRGVLEIGRKATDLYQGRMPVAVAIFRNGDTSSIQVSFVGKGRRQKPRFYLLQSVLSGKAESFNARVQRKIRIGLSHDQCGVTGEQRVPAEVLSVRSTEESARVSATARVVEIATEADALWHARYGGNSNDTIAALLDAAEVIYARDLGLTFSISAQNVHQGSSPYDGITDAEILLPTFQNYTLQNSHLG